MVLYFCIIRTVLLGTVNRFKREGKEIYVISLPSLGLKGIGVKIDVIWWEDNFYLGVLLTFSRFSELSFSLLGTFPLLRRDLRNPL